MARRQHVTLIFAICVIFFMSITYYMSPGSSSIPLPNKSTASESKADGAATIHDGKAQKSVAELGFSESILTGGSIAPKLENATAKAELGRAAWKLFHTMMARFPEKPSADDSLALKTYIQLFARLYPCGDCASHFQKLLAKYPPQTSNRNAAAGWACFVHNEVNKRLKKEQFDCNKIGDFYDCGCGDEKKEGEEGKKEKEIEKRRYYGIHVDMDRLKKGEVNCRRRPSFSNCDLTIVDDDSMAITFKDGVILGADSRTTTGAYIANRVTDKLTRVHDTIWCCRSGSAADTQAVADIVQYQLGLFSMQSGKPPTTQTAASIFQEICYANKDRLSAGLIIAGWDERHGGQVYSIPLGGSLHKQPYAIGGSGSTYIYGFCDANWREGMEEADAVGFVKEALKEAIKWDGSSGGVIRMVVLTAKGADRHLYLPDTDYTVRHN
ncbi:Nucleophile aminohydrolase [Rhypophila decipiens]